ncbi:RNA-binding ribosome biosynthesis protein mak21 [Dipsacomyces acuminosporus]|nr:RNA-binding ribosome biosynthesis protein mak21 [Dipsacomyces acuminosporus]
MANSSKPPHRRGRRAAKDPKQSEEQEKKALWEEIQKMGGGKEDLKMLEDVDTGRASGKKGSRPASAAATAADLDSASLHGDLSAFAKSLGLATDIPEFVGLPESERKPAKAKEPKKSKDKKVAKRDEQTDKKAKANDAPANEPTKAKEPKAGKKSKNKAEKPSSNANVAPKGEDEDDEDALSIPGFKIKSARDSQPLSKSMRLIVEPNPQWFMIPLGELKINEGAARPGEDVVMQKLAYAEGLLENENTLYASSGEAHKSLSTADRSFVSNILSSGTLSDRVSALTLIVQESPVHNMKALNQLMQMVQKKNRREALLAVGSVKDLMAINLLPSNRKLKYFADQPVTAEGITATHWIMWAFEDKLKRHYFDLIKTIESMAYDPLLHTRQNMIVYIEDLLEQKPEQEQNLLRLLVNKLGDTEKQLAAKTSYLILKLLNVHPNMKYVVVKTIQELLLTKSSTKERAQYYTMITLNQIILSSKDAQTANLLLEVYFVFFKKLLKLTRDTDEDEAAVDDGEDAKEPSSNTAKGKKQPPKKAYVGQKALKKAKEEAEKKRAEEERSMGNKLLAAILTGLNRALPFAQMEDEIMDKHIGVIFQIAHAGNFNTVVQSLVLLFQIVRQRPGIGDRFYRTLYDSLLDHRLDSTSKKAMYLNVLFRALKSDSNIPRVMSFIKRILQVCLYNQAEFASGALYLVSQILSVNPQIYTMLTQPEDNDDEEAFVDAGSDDERAADDKPRPKNNTYDPLKRDPRFAHSDASCLWEAVFDGEQVPAISNLHNHSLTHFLDRFVFRKPKSEASADADKDLGDDSGAAFAPAKTHTLRGQSIMQPFVNANGPDVEIGPNRARVVAGDHLITSKRIGGVIGGLDLTSERVTKLQKSEIPADEQFFYQFFQTKKARAGNRVKRSKHTGGDDDGDDDDDEGSIGGGFADDTTGFASAVKGGDEELGEDEIWKAMTASMPKAQGADEDEADIDGEDEDLLAALREDEEDLETENEDGDEDEDEDEGDDDESEESDASESEDGDDFPTFDDELSDELSGSDIGEPEDEIPGAKRKAKDEEPAKKKKKKAEKMPMFASFEDYAHLIDNDEGLE